MPALSKWKNTFLVRTDFWTTSFEFQRNKTLLVTFSLFTRNYRILRLQIMWITNELHVCSHFVQQKFLCTSYEKLVKPFEFRIKFVYISYERHIKSYKYFQFPMNFMCRLKPFRRISYEWYQPSVTPPWRAKWNDKRFQGLRHSNKMIQ